MVASEGLVTLKLRRNADTLEVLTLPTNTVLKLIQASTQHTGKKTTFRVGSVGHIYNTVVTDIRDSEGKALDSVTVTTELGK